MARNLLVDEVLAALRASAETRLSRFEVVCSRHLSPGDPVCIVLGWYGANLRHVSKYAAALGDVASERGRGVAALAAVCPPAAVMAPLSLWRRRFAEACLGAVEGSGLLDGGTRPLYLYCFSNGGAFVVKEMYDLLGKGDGGPSPGFPLCAGGLAGCAFDSAPCYLHAATGVRAVTEGQPLWLKPLLALAFALVSLPAGACVRGAFWRAFERAPGGRRELFVYSQVDPLCDDAKVAELVRTRREVAGARAVGINFKDSLHVQHMRKYADRYRHALGEWLFGDSFGTGASR